MRLSPLAIIIIIVSLLALTGCASEPDSARRTADQFLTALERGDRAAVEKYLTPAARQRGAMGVSDFAPTGSGNSHSLGTPTVSGNMATVPVTLTDNSENQDVNLYLRKEGSTWGVYGLGMPMAPGGPEIKIDFENPENSIAETMHSVGKGLGQVVSGFEKGVTEFQKGFEEGYGKTVAPPVHEEKGKITETQ